MDHIENEGGFSPLALEIMWGRLLAIVDESATALQRTSFSTTVRESNDFACVLLSPDGNSVVENTIGVPSFAGVMSRMMGVFLRTHPVESWRPGDVGITNDPWTNTGHLPDTAVVTPVFRAGELVAFAVNTAHKSDIGGGGYSAAATEIYEEGLRIPPSKLFREGVRNEELFELIRSNVRVSELVIGDIEAQVAAGHFCGDRLVAFMDEQKITEVVSLGRAIQRRAEGAMRRAISALPDGEYHGQVELDGFDEPIILRGKITIAGDELEVDFAGTSPQVAAGINSVYNYTHAFTSYALKCVLDPFTRKNEGSYAPITIKAPEGSVLNASFPAAVNARSMVGHCVAPVVFMALSQAAPDRVMADSGSCPGLRVCCYGVDRYGSRFVQMLFPNGGAGARPALDGLSATPYPTNAGGASVEVLEGVAPLVVWRRELIPDSGGVGKYRGGLGQRMVVEFASPEPVMFTTQFDRVEHPPNGLFGGGYGAPAALRLNETQTLPSKGKVVAQPGDQLTIVYAGGGGLGDVSERDPAAVASDVRNGYVSAQAAAELYGFEGELV